MRHPRFLVVFALLGACVFAPDAGASSIVHAVGGELAKSGAKAAIVHFAPSLAQHVDPTSYQLTQIREQLQQLDSKLTELADYQSKAFNQHECTVHKVQLTGIVSSAQSHLDDLAVAGTIHDAADRIEALNGIWADRGTLATEQQALHNHVMDGALLACARKIESGMFPFVTPRLAPAVRDLYAAWEAAAISLLTVRMNLIAYKPGPSGGIHRADEINTQVHKWIEEERSLIKPAVPSGESFDVRRHGKMRTHVVGGLFGKSEVDALQSAGWWVTGRTTIPTCSAIQGVVQETKLQGVAALNLLRAWGAIDLPNEIECYDDHDKLHYFDLTRFSYARPSLQNMKFLKGVAWKAVARAEIDRFSYGS